MILAERWLHPGSVVVADNILVPGAPAYRAHMRDNDGPEPQYNELWMSLFDWCASTAHCGELA
jgi:predicted O-methyltransferase YrrM